jgi:hypothetical protein
MEFGEFKGRMEVWRRLFKGVEYARLWLESPRALKVQGIRIDLQEPGIEFLTTPSNGDRPLDTDSMTTSEFLVKQGCQLAINASPFTPFDRLSSEEGLPKDVQGVSVSRGDVYSGPEKDFGAILISKDNRAWVSKPPMELDRAYNGVGGFSMVLEKGKIAASQDTLHPRTAAGVSADGRYVFWMVVDGRQLGFSEGVSIVETAELIRFLGACDAVNLDGGGSTAMVISDGQGGARVLNRPIHLGIPCLERPVANHLGVFAKPLP